MSGKSEAPAGDAEETQTIPVVAKRLGVSAMTVRRAVDDGEFPHVSVRSKKLIPKGFVDGLLASPKWGVQPKAEVQA